MKRYKVVAGLYGGYDIVDRTIGEETVGTIYRRICTCFASEDAERICNTMNEQAVRDKREDEIDESIRITK